VGDAKPTEFAVDLAPRCKLLKNFLLKASRVAIGGKAGHRGHDKRAVVSGDNVGEVILISMDCALTSA
jgi:hypothetical protein